MFYLINNKLKIHPYQFQMLLAVLDLKDSFARH